MCKGIKGTVKRDKGEIKGTEGIKINPSVPFNYNAIKAILNAVPYERHDPQIDFVPDHNIVISGAHEIELMEAERLRGGKFTG